MCEVLAATVKQMMPTVITMLAVLGCAKVMGYAGMISAVSSFCIAVTGSLFPLMAPVIGAVGAFVTGSGTSSGCCSARCNSRLRRHSAWTPTGWWRSTRSAWARARSISPQTLAIGLAAVKTVGVEGKLLARVMPIAIVFMVLMAALGLGGALLL